MMNPFLLLTLFLNAAAPSETTPEGQLTLSIEAPERIPVGQRARFSVRVRLTNDGASPVLVSPSIGEIASQLTISVRPTGQKGRPLGGTGYGSRLESTGTYSIDDLFRLLPGRSMSQAFVVQYEPSFQGEGSVDIWAEYDCRQMANVDPLAFHGSLESAHEVVPVRGHSLELSLGSLAQIDPDERTLLSIGLSLWNRGFDPVYVAPAMGLMATQLEIFARPTAATSEGTLLFASLPIDRRDYTLDDLFRLMPGRQLFNEIWVDYKPIIKGEGTVEVWAEYNCEPMAKNAPGSFAGRVKSAPITLVVKKRPREVF